MTQDSRYASLVKLRSLVIMLPVLGLFACSPAIPPNPASPTTAPPAPPVTAAPVADPPASLSTGEPEESSHADDDLREVVMRELIKSFGSMKWAERANQTGVPVKVLCLGFGEKSDPSDAFMKRLADEPRVVKASKCEQIGTGRRGIRSVPGGEEAMFLQVYDLHKSNGRAEVKGSYFHDGLAAKEDLFVLEHEAGHWVVKSRKMLSIS